MSSHSEKKNWHGHLSIQAYIFTLKTSKIINKTTEHLLRYLFYRLQGFISRDMGIERRLVCCGHKQAVTPYVCTHTEREKFKFTSSLFLFFSLLVQPASTMGSIVGQWPLFYCLKWELSQRPLMEAKTNVSNTQCIFTPTELLGLEAGFLPTGTCSCFPGYFANSQKRVKNRLNAS